MYSVPFVQSLYARGSLQAIWTWETLYRLCASSKVATCHPFDLPRLATWEQWLGLGVSGGNVSRDVVQNGRFAGLVELLNLGLIEYLCTYRNGQYGIRISAGTSGPRYHVAEGIAAEREFMLSDAPGSLGYTLHSALDFQPLPKRRVGSAQVWLRPPAASTAPRIARPFLEPGLFGRLHPVGHRPPQVVALYGWLARELARSASPIDDQQIVQGFSRFRVGVRRAQAREALDALSETGVIHAV